MRKALYDQLVGYKNKSFEKTASAELNSLDPEKMAAIAEEIRLLSKQAEAEDDQDDVAVEPEEETQTADEAIQDVEAEVPTEEAPAEEAPVEEAPAEEAPAEEAPAEEAPVEEAPVEEAPVEGIPGDTDGDGELTEEEIAAYEQLMAMLAQQAEAEKTAATNTLLGILKEAAEQEAIEAQNAEIVNYAEKLAFEIFEDVLPKLEVSAEKYASLFVEESFASKIGQNAEKIAAEQGVSVYRAVDDIISAISASIQSE